MSHIFTNRRLTKLFTAALLGLSLSVTSAQNTTPSGNPPGGAPPAGGAAPGAAASTTNPVLTATCGIYTLDGTSSEDASTGTYDSASTDVSALCLIDGAALDLSDVTITKTGDTSSDENSSFYGLNAGVLVGSGSTLTITGGTVKTNGAGTNGVFASGADSVVTLKNLSIEAVGNGAHAVMATLGGTLILDNVDMLTTDAHSGAIATDRGSGTITATGGTVTTTGTDSPGIYSTGIITVNGATVTSTGAEAAVIEGSNSIMLTDTDLSSTFADKWGVMIYQSFSGDAEGSDGVFTMTGGSLRYTAENGPLFFLTNTTGTITLSQVEMSAASGVLVQAGATDRWGTSGANGGHVILLADAQTLVGDLLADSISTLDIRLQNGSHLTGAMNPDSAAQAATLTLDASSTWTLTADSYLTGFTGELSLSGDIITNINGNGFNIYYDASAAANSALGGNSYALVGGGYLMPKG